MRPGRVRLDRSSVNELAKRGFGYADVAAYANEPDAPLDDEPPGKPRLCPEEISGFFQGQKPIDSRAHSCYRASFG